MDIYNLVFVWIVLVASTAVQGRVRIVGGQVKGEGRVEVYINGAWGTICDDSWDINDANVVCRILGIANATNAPPRAAFGPGSGRIWLNNVRCMGNETNLLECKHDGIGKHNCFHSEDASVVCGSTILHEVKITNLSGVITSPGYPYYMLRANYQWIFTPNISRARVAVYFDDLDLKRRSGKVQVKIDGKQVINRENYEEAVRGYWLMENPSQIRYYSSYSTKRDDGKGIRMRYLVLQEVPGSCEKDWGISVQANISGLLIVTWNVPPSRQGFSHFTFLVQYNATDTNRKNFVLTSDTKSFIKFLRPGTWYSVQVVALSTSGKTLYSCPKLVKTENVKWRLTGGKSKSEGRIDVYYNGKWGRVCALQWDMKDAAVACRSFHLPPATFALTDIFQFQITKEISSVSGLNCNGNEKSLEDCPNAGWRKIPSKCGLAFFQAGVVCGHPTVTVIKLRAVSGLITSPGYPESMNQAHYKWTFQSSRSSHVVLYFDDMSLFRLKGKSYIKVIDSLTSREVVKKGGYVLGQPAQVEFYSSFTYPGRGFRMLYLEFDQSLAINAQVQNITNLSVSSKGPQRIVFSWSQFRLPGFTVAAYLLICSPKDIWHLNTSYIIVSNETSKGACHDLVGATRYEAEVYIILERDDNSRVNIYKSSKHVVQTTEGVPSSSPKNLDLSLVRPRDVLVQWEGISRKDAHGKIKGYNVEAFDQGNAISTRVKTNMTQVVIKNLKPATRYYITVAAFTAIGAGPSSYGYITTRCGSLVNDSIYGTIVSPQSYSARWWAIDCEWKIRASSRAVIVVTTINQKERSKPSCRNFRITFMDNKGRTKRFCEEPPSLTFTSIGSLTLQFFSSHRVISQRSRSEYLLAVDYYVFNNGINHFSVSSDWTIMAKRLAGKVIFVRWPVPAYKFITKYMVIVTSKQQSHINAVVKKGGATNATLNNLKDSDDYIVQVLAFEGKLSGGVRQWSQVVRASMRVNVNRRISLLPIRTPSSQDIQNSVNVTVVSLSKWDYDVNLRFKMAVALQVTKFCADHELCFPSRLAKRSLRTLLNFTSDQVHLLPGFPIQLQNSLDQMKSITVVAFYVQYPMDFFVCRNCSIDGLILLRIINDSLDKIGKQIGRHLLKASLHSVKYPKTQNTGSASPKQSAIIGGVVGAVIAMLVFVFAIVLIRRRRIQDHDQMNQPVVEMMETNALEEPVTAQAKGTVKLGDAPAEMNI